MKSQRCSATAGQSSSVRFEPSLEENMKTKTLKQTVTYGPQAAIANSKESRARPPVSRSTNRQAC